MGDLTDMMNAQMDNDQPAYPRSRAVPPSKTIPASKNSAGSFYAPEAVPMKLAPLSSDLVIRGGNGRNLITFHADGTVTGEVEDASEAAAVLFRELQRLTTDTRAAHDAELTEKVRAQFIEASQSMIAAYESNVLPDHIDCMADEACGACEAMEALRTLSTTPERSNT